MLYSSPRHQPLSQLSFRVKMRIASNSYVRIGGMTGRDGSPLSPRCWIYDSTACSEREMPFV